MSGEAIVWNRKIEIRQDSLNDVVQGPRRSQGRRLVLFDDEIEEPVIANSKVATAARRFK